MARLSVIIPDEMKIKLDSIAEKQDRNLSYVVRKVLENYISKSEASDCKGED